MSRKPLDIVASVLTTALFAFAVCFAVLAVVTKLSTVGGQTSFFGWRPYIVMSDSMQGVFDVGDIVVSREVDPLEIGPGDVVTFHSADPGSFDEVVTHKVREVVVHEGSLAFVTYGTTTGDNDPTPVTLDRIAGEYVFRIPKAGYAFEFFKSPAGYLVLVLVPLGVLIGLQIRCFLRLLGEGRSRKLDALAAERLKAEHMQVELCRPQSADRSDIPVCTRVVDPTASHVRAAILRDLPVIVLEPPKRGKHAH